MNTTNNPALWLIAGAFALAVSVAAEEPGKNEAAVKACLDIAAVRKAAAPDEPTPKTGPEAHLDAAALNARSAPENCIGVVADPCLATEEGQSTYGMMDCYGRERDVWDARLNASYRERQAPGDNAPYADIEAKQLRKIQLAWIAWRDATCETLYADGIPIYGSSSKVDAVYCDLVLTARQALWMEGSLSTGFDQ